MRQKLIHVAGALIFDNGRYLLAQRNADDRFGDLWEFPGGCIEDGETAFTCIAREIDEELGMIVAPVEEAALFDDELPDLKIIVHLVRCRIKEGHPSTKDCQAVGWFKIEQISDLDLAPADKKIFAWICRKEGIG